MLSSVTRYVFNYVIDPEKYKTKLDINDKKLNFYPQMKTISKITLHLRAFASLNFQF